MRPEARRGGQTKNKSLASITLFDGVSPNLLKLVTDDMVGSFTTGSEIVREGDAAEA